MNAPALDVLEIQLRQIQSQINTIIGHVTSRDDVTLAQEGRLRVHLEYAEQAITKAWSIVHVAAKDVARRNPPMDPNSIEAAREAIIRG